MMSHAVFDGPSASAVVLDATRCQDLIDALVEDGYTVLGPTVRDGAVVIDEVREANCLPVGWEDVQEGGVYRLVPTDEPSLFACVVGPHAWKRYLFPPERVLWRAERDGTGKAFAVIPESDEAPLQAFFGMRPCDLAALAVQDRVFLEGPYVDPVYAARRARVFVVAVQCTRAAATCFCASMGTGPAAGPGYDLAVTEVLSDERHALLVEPGSDAGTGVLERLQGQPATDADISAARAGVQRAATSQSRTLATDGLRDRLMAALNHPHWDDVAERCLACANCTMVCPTCFCSTVEDVTSLDGRTAERRQRWDSCFTEAFSYLHGGSVRRTHRARYRQWLIHKLASWVDQFGTFGCVGCGRCITWCPVGIDLTEEVEALTRTIHSAEASPEESP